ncbi:L,D-transpeptidase, partial [Rhizobium ruizarguesonis]
RPASHGCVRLHFENAAQFFSLAPRAGLAKTRVVITR